MPAEPAPAGKLFVKICGVASASGAECAATAGADAIGVNLFEGSRRFVPLEECARWLPGLAGRVLRVAVVVNPSGAQMGRLREAGVFDAVQFHGEESPEDCARCGFDFWIKAVRVSGSAALEQALEFDTPHLLLDAWSPVERGGTGQLADWGLARDFAARHPSRRVLLAGGLTPANVGEAVRRVRPFGVDVAGGVESAPGIKDPGLVRAFVQAAREAAKP
ncbi:MAG: phosphoribosylanthranilate isomerase [Terrimicrobiaceae bacterium]|nr:phosphoribosylanthranilate isomerase [Terrimicrobiaceae bacterium]